MPIQSLLILLTGCIICEVKGHGRLLQPPSRVSLWRSMAVDNSLKEYDDNAYNCGGKYNQWEYNDGKCGICGDPFQGPFKSEQDGQYDNKIIVERYATGEIIDVTVEITANHKGWFEFRLCPVDDGLSDATLECLDDHLLPLADGSGSRYQLPATEANSYLQLQLPADVTCSRCVLQWKYNAGNDWGCDYQGGPCGIGHGNQEQFYACADIEIYAFGGNASEGSGENTTTNTPQQESATTSTPEPESATTSDPQPESATTSDPQPESATTSDPQPETPECRGAGNLSDSEEVATQCVAACQSGCCPTQLCNDACRQ